MPPTNARMEAMRLEQAKLAIKKMKRNRQGANGQRSTFSNRAMPHELPAPEVQQHLGKVLVPSNDVNPRQPVVMKDRERPFMKSSSVKSSKTSSRKRAAKEPAREDTVQRRRKLANDRSLVTGLLLDKISVDINVESSDTDMRPDAVGHKLFYSPGGHNASPMIVAKEGLPMLKCIPRSAQDHNDTKMGLTPRTPELTFDPLAPRNVYRNSSCTSDSHLTPLEVVMNGTWESLTDDVIEGPALQDKGKAEDAVSKLLPPRIKTTKKMKMMKKLKVASSKLHGKGRKDNAPMSVKMRTNVVKKPLSRVTPDGAVKRSDKPQKGIRKQLSAINLSNSGRYRSGFSVTTVPESKLLLSEESSDEVASNESLEEITHEDETLDDEYIDEKEEVVNESYNDATMIQFHFIDEQVILHLKHPSTFVFCGQVQVQVLKGAVEVLGYRLIPSSGSHTIFSPKGSSLLTLQTMVVDSDNFTIPSIDMNSNLLTTLVQKGNKNDSYLLMTKADDKLSLFLEQYMTVKLFPRPSDKQEGNPFQKASNKLQCLCYPPIGCKIFAKEDTWEELSTNIIQQKGCTVLCGGKGVGKSTMLRFLVNRYISNGEQGVLLIDLDPGQAELTMPGCISLSVVKKPLLGPNFTHLQDPLKCVYIGDINVTNCVSQFMDACLTIVNFWQSQEQLKDMPCIVNTMGFNKGLGITIMVQMIALLQPSSVIQIYSESATRNYPENLTEEYVKKNCSSSPFTMQLHTLGRRLSLANILNYNLYLLQSLAETNAGQTKAWGLEAKFSRELVILSYLSKIICPPNHSLLEVVPYCCPLDSLYLSVSHEPVPPSVTVPTFNASLVALCEANPDTGIVQASGPGFPSIITGHFTAYCVGFGIVRGIDMEAKQLYLLSPVPPKILSPVNCLVLGAICLPPSIYLTPPREPCSVPYVMVSESKHAAKPLKRSFRYSRPAMRL